MLNSVKLRKDLTKIPVTHDPNVDMNRVVTWARMATERKKFLDSISHLRGKEYSDAVVGYDKQVPRRLW